MNTDYIAFCSKHYESTLDEADKARLHFFEGLWAVMEKCQKDYTEVEYDIPDHEQLITCYVNQTPLFDIASPLVDMDAFVQTAQAITVYLSESGVYEDADKKILNDIDWKNLIVQHSPNTYEGKPKDWVLICGEALYEQQEVPMSMTRVAMQVLTLALFTFYEPYAAALMEEIGEDEVISVHPLQCPVCGSDPALASVGNQTSSDGRGRKLYCSTCGTAWEFNRVRCARCGTTDQTKLHFFNLEGDDTHRIATCDECGEYIRTTFLENKLVPLSYLVEDVVMARLDALAQDSRFRTLSVESLEKNQ